MSERQRKTAIIIGAGPAGLTAALELLRRSDIRPVVLEQSTYMGGISRTVEHHGNRIDIGGHRFFSKSDRVMEWWMDILPLQRLDGRRTTITYHRGSRDLTTEEEGPDPETEDRVMLLRSRRSRIYFNRTFFDYPITLSFDTLRKLGPWRTIRIGLSYLRSTLMPIREEKTLEQFFINRFGRELYETFFKSYTEKVWGVSCDQISAEWGAQRVKGLSIRKVILHYLKKLVPRRADVRQKDVETSLIEQFLYPKLGPGQMWDEVARKITAAGGEILTRWEVVGILTDGANRVRGVRARNRETGEERELSGDYVFSSMPVRKLIAAMDLDIPEEVRSVAEGLMYRDFVAVGLLVKRLRVSEPDGSLIRDNWIYIQEPDVLLGRLQIFNNWSPYMVADPESVWIGLEYFCNQGDALWNLDDDKMAALGVEELTRIRIVDPSDVLDSVVLRMPKTYPAYFGTYPRFDVIRSFTDRFENLFLVGRNGMHRYNNQDHSMLTAMVAVDNIVEGRTDKSNLWEINTEEEYHEEKSS
ncbi:MAG: NAD(P)/FAD-dependent oxidoreductase [Thermoanaerobaculia bacterium]